MNKAYIIIPVLLIQALTGDTVPIGTNLRVYVLTDTPNSTIYEALNGTPTTVGIYEFYLKDPLIPGSGDFRLIDQIPLEMVNQTCYYGEKWVEFDCGAVCVGFPSTNFVDGIAVAPLNENDSTVIVHYWRCKIGILGIQSIAIVANSIDWGLCSSLIVNQVKEKGIIWERYSFENMNDAFNSDLVVVLGGPLSPEGVGSLSSSILPPSISEKLIENLSFYTVYSTLNVWRDRQLVIVIAGHDRNLTRKALIEYIKG